MILSFKHRGLEQFFESGTTRGIQANHAKRIRLILARLSAATSPQDMNLPGLVLHELAGQRKGTWTVRVSGNWGLPENKIPNKKIEKCFFEKVIIFV